MANDIVMLMNALQIQTFSLIGHDRGRVGHRLALDYPHPKQAVLY
jgi:haloacetate dehalogenase